MYVLGPVLFLLNTAAELVRLIEQHGLKVHLCTNDSQVNDLSPNRDGLVAVAFVNVSG
jgi:hypothetical protein